AALDAEGRGFASTAVWSGFGGAGAGFAARVRRRMRKLPTAVATRSAPRRNAATAKSAPLPDDPPRPTVLPLTVRVERPPGVVAQGGLVPPPDAESESGGGRSLGRTTGRAFVASGSAVVPAGEGRRSGLCSSSGSDARRRSATSSNVCTRFSRS